MLFLSSDFSQKTRKSSMYFFLNYTMNYSFWLLLCALEHEIESWKDFKRALRPQEQEILNKLMNFARIHADAGSLSARPMLSEILFMSFAIEQEKKIEICEKRIKELEEKINGKE